MFPKLINACLAVLNVAMFGVGMFLRISVFDHSVAAMVAGSFWFLNWRSLRTGMIESKHDVVLHSDEPRRFAASAFALMALFFAITVMHGLLLMRDLNEVRP